MVALTIGLTLAPVIPHGTLGSFLRATEPPVSPAAQAETEAEHLYQRGKQQFEAGDAVAALVAWNQAYVLLTPTPESRANRSVLVLAIVGAHEQAHASSSNPEHLAEALRLIADHEAELQYLYDDDPEALSELAQLELRRADLRRAQNAALGREEVPTDLPSGSRLHYHNEGPLPVAAPTPGPITSPPVVRGEADPESHPQFREGRQQVVGGVVSLAIGGAAIFPTVALALWSVPAGALGGDSRGAVAGAAVVGAASVVLTCTGGVMIGVGMNNQRRARERFARSVLAPVVVRRGGGLAVVFAF